MEPGVGADIMAPRAPFTLTLPRVYVLILQDSWTTRAITGGIFLINNAFCRVLFDSGATYSLADYAFAIGFEDWVVIPSFVYVYTLGHLA